MIDAAIRWGKDVAGFPVSVAVVDGAGGVIAAYRSEGASPETLEIAMDKAFTAVAFEMPTRMAARMTSPKASMALDVDQHGTSLLFRHKGRWCTVNGGIPIREAGTSMGMNVIGGIGTSGCPSGEDDNKCSQAGFSSLYD
jgi:uncharacterized protein GlcG (DUF336 family)